MRILHLIKSLGRGGAEMLLPETIALHDRERFDFRVAYFLPWKTAVVPLLEAQGVPVRCFPARNNVQMMLQAGKLIRYVREERIDLIHCHLPWAGFLGRLIHLRTGIPVVYTEHNKQERYHGITRRLNQLSFNRQTAAIAVSGDVADSIRELIAPSVEVHTVLNGVNTRRFVRNEAAGQAIRRQYGIAPEAPVVGNLAVFRFQKRLDCWLEVVRELHQRIPALRAVLVGDGPLKGEIEGKVKACGLEDVVVMPGLQTDTMNWYSAMDLFMMSSSFEGLPIALLEAMSCGCAVVSTNAGGIREVIRDGMDGLLVDVDAWQQLADRSESMLRDRDMLQQFGNAARSRVVEAFSLERMVRELEQIYMKVPGLGFSV